MTLITMFAKSRNLFR